MFILQEDDTAVSPEGNFHSGYLELYADIQPASGSVNTSGLSLFGLRLGALVVAWDIKTLERLVRLGARAMQPLQAAWHPNPPPIIHTTQHFKPLKRNKRANAKPKKKKVAVWVDKYAGEGSGSCSTIAGFGCRQFVCGLLGGFRHSMKK